MSTRWTAERHLDIGIGNAGSTGDVYSQGRRRKSCWAAITGDRGCASNFKSVASRGNHAIDESDVVSMRRPVLWGIQFAGVQNNPIIRANHGQNRRKVGPASSRQRQRPPVSYTHLRAHETDSYLVCRLL